MILRIHLFGEPRLLVDEQPFRFSAPPRTFPLLAYLLLHRDRPVNRQQIAFALWPDEPESGARANLRRHLHHLRHALPPGPEGLPWLLLEDAGVQWNPQAPFWLDVAEMERLAGCPDTLEQAVQLYRGDLLETVYDDWVFPRREELRELYYSCLERLISRHRSGRDYPTAVRYARQLLASDPFREDAQRQLMAVLYEGGNRAGALQEFETFERRLRQEMGVAPMPETRALYEIILRNARLPGEVSQATLPGTTCVGSLLPFMGRQAEMETLLARWSSAARGRGGLLLIGGEAGVGKSRLARECSLVAEAQGGRVISGAAYPRETRPYQAVVEALQNALPLIRTVQEDPRRQALLAELLSGPRRGRRQRVLYSPDAEKERLRLFDAAASLLVKLAEPRPLLLILEDLHWAGESTLELLEYIARRAAGAALLILGTYRDEEIRRGHPLNALRRNLRAEGLVEHLPLGRLSKDSVEAMLAQVNSAAAGPDAELADWLFGESEGNPLFIQILWQQVQAEGYPKRPLPERDSLAGEIRPAIRTAIRAAIARRLDQLSPSTRAYAQVAAVLGTAFEAETAREVGGWNEIQAYDALRDLLDCRILHDAGGRQRCDYRFSHHLIQAVLYEDIPLASRKRRHRRAAEVIEDLYPEAREQFASELAIHYDQGGAQGEAIACYRTAAQRYLEIFDDSQALRCLNRAIQLHEQVAHSASSRLLVDLLLLREGVYSRRGKREEQYADLERLASLAESLGEPSLKCEALKRQILYYRALDDRPNMESHIKLLNQQVETLSDLQWRGEAAQIEGNYLKLLNEFRRAIARLREALAIYRQLDDIQGQIACCCQLAEIAIMKRESDEASHWAQEALALCSTEAPSDALLVVLWNIAAQGLMVKDLERCVEYSQKLLEAAEQAGDRVWQAHAHRLQGMAFQRLFRIAEARKSLETAYAFYQMVQKPKGRALTMQAMGHVEIAVGHYEAALRSYQEALELNRQLNDRQGITEESINIAFAACLLEDFETAKKAAGEALSLARELESRHLQAYGLQNLGDAERGLGEFEAARKHFLEARALFTEPGELEERISVEADLALTYLKMGCIPEAVCCAEEILEHYPSIADVDDNTHRFLWCAAQALHAAGEEERAAEALNQAYRALQKSLALIPDAESRRAFAATRYNREIEAAYLRGEWA